MHKIKSKNQKHIQKILLGIVVFSFLTIGCLIAFYFFSDPERTIKSKISALASDYYENFIYETLANSESLHDLDETLETYTETGLSSVYLRQLLYHDNKTDQSTIDLLKRHCNENKTSVKFFPMPPYSKTSYRTEYIYSCNFE